MASPQVASLYSPCRHRYLFPQFTSLQHTILSTQYQTTLKMDGKGDNDLLQVTT